MSVLLLESSSPLPSGCSLQERRSVSIHSEKEAHLLKGGFSMLSWEEWFKEL